jgi:hypothetical protein
VLRKTDNYHLDAATIRLYSKEYGTLKSDEELEKEQAAAANNNNGDENDVDDDDDDDAVAAVLEAAAAQHYGYQAPTVAEKFRQYCECFATIDVDRNLVLDQNEFKQLHAQMVENKLTQLPLEDSWDEVWF